MKKIFNSILILFTASIFLVACDKDNFTVLNSNATTTVSLSVSDVVLDKDNAGMEVLSVSWTEPDYGFDAGATYKVNFTYGEKSAAVNVGTDLSKVFENVELNKILLNLGFEGGTASEVVINIQATLSESTNIISNNISLLATVYEDKLDLSTTWGIVGSGYNNWGETPDAPFFKTDDANVIVAYVTLVDGEIKVRENNEWGNDYGDANLDGVLDKDSDNNIAVTAGTYKFTMNTSTLAYSIEEFTWGLVGSATVNSWDGPDMPLTYDSYTDTWKAIVTLADGEIKIRQNNTWGTDYGDADSNGVLDQDSDNNIAVTAGNYLVTVDLNTFEYSLEAIDIWGLVGSAAPNGWDGPNERFTLDFSQDDVWVLNGVTLIDGEIKFRTNDSWDVNYGDATGDGILDQDDGNNIAVTAGTYNIVLNFSNPSEPVYSITAI